MTEAAAAATTTTTTTRRRRAPAAEAAAPTNGGHVDASTFFANLEEGGGVDTPEYDADEEAVTEEYVQAILLEENTKAADPSLVDLFQQSIANNEADAAPVAANGKKAAAAPKESVTEQKLANALDSFTAAVARLSERVDAQEKASEKRATTQGDGLKALSVLVGELPSKIAAQLQAAFASKKPEPATAPAAAPVPAKATAPAQQTNTQAASSAAAATAGATPAVKEGTAKIMAVIEQCFKSLKTGVRYNVEKVAVVIAENYLKEHVPDTEVVKGPTAAYLKQLAQKAGVLEDNGEFFALK